MSHIHVDKCTEKNVGDGTPVTGVKSRRYDERFLKGRHRFSASSPILHLKSSTAANVPLVARDMPADSLRNVLETLGFSLALNLRTWSRKEQTLCIAVPVETSKFALSRRILPVLCTGVQCEERF